MAKHGSGDFAWFLVDGFDIRGVSTQVEETQEAVVEETTPLGVNYPTHEFANETNVNLTQQGFYDDASDGVNAALSGNQSVSRVVCYALEGNTAGKHFTGMAGAFGGSYVRQASSGTLHKANAAFTMSGNVDVDGVILHTLTAETSAGNTQGADSVDNSASSAGGGAGYLQVTSLSLDGYTNLTVKVRHSADDVTYADLLTFTAVTGTRTAERKTVSSTVNRHLAASWAYTGSGTSPSATFMVGFKRAA